MPVPSCLYKKKVSVAAKTLAISFTCLRINLISRIFVGLNFGELTYMEFIVILSAQNCKIPQKLLKIVYLTFNLPVKLEVMQNYLF